jgi:hypothetical protein
MMNAWNIIQIVKSKLRYLAENSLIHETISKNIFFNLEKAFSLQIEDFHRLGNNDSILPEYRPSGVSIALGQRLSMCAIVSERICEM